MKKFLAVLLVVAMTLSLCACGGSKKMSPEDVLKATSENMNKFDSTGFHMNMEMGLNVQGMDMAVKVAASGECIKEPMTMHMNMSMEAAMMAMKMEMYAQNTDEGSVSYVGMDMGSGMQWGKQVGEAVPEMPMDGMADLLHFYTDLKEVGKEKINGVETTQYDAKITGKNLKNVLEAMSKLSGESAGDAAAIFEKLGDDASASVSFFIDTKNMVMAECRMDLTELIQPLVNAEEMGGEVNKVTISVGYDNFNKIDKIEIPQEALNAPEM